jgi:magnesium transporter
MHAHQAALTHIIEVLDKYDLALALARKQSTPQLALEQALIERQHLTKIQHKLQRLHPADIAYVLENLPWERRALIWQLLPPTLNGAVLLELSDAVRETLLAHLDVQEIIGATQHLDSNEIADLVPDLPKGLVRDVLQALERKSREQVQALLHFPQGTVGALMDLDMVSVRDDVELEVVLRYLRRFSELPESLSQLYVVDRNGILTGVLPLKELLIRDITAQVAQLMLPATHVFQTSDSARDSALTFERYGLLNAPVVNIHGQLVGNLGADAVMDFMSAHAQHELLIQAGLKEGEDLFAPVWKSGKNRWPWLALNLFTAFIASRMIGLFEDSITQLVALATLMPIVAGIGGNTGTQAIALVVRGLALKQVSIDNFSHLLSKELLISIMNGLLWGSVMGFIAYLLYGDFFLGAVMMVAMLLTLILAGFAGVMIPWTLYRLKRDPAIGASILLTAITDSMGFFIFLGLATVFLL